MLRLRLFGYILRLTCFHGLTASFLLVYGRVSPPASPGSLDDDHPPLDLRECALIIREVEPHRLPLVLELEPEVVVPGDREVLTDVVESHVTQGFAWNQEEVELLY